jgi:hypothetical protein
MGGKKKSASGTPKRHRTSLSAATGEVLTRFARRRPSDLRHLEYNRLGTLRESVRYQCCGARFELYMSTTYFQLPSGCFLSISRNLPSSATPGSAFALGTAEKR